MKTLLQAQACFINPVVAAASGFPGTIANNGNAVSEASLKMLFKGKF